VHSKLHKKAAALKEARQQLGEKHSYTFKPEITATGQRLDRNGPAHDRLHGMAKPPTKKEQPGSPAREAQEAEPKEKCPPPGFSDFAQKVEQWEKERQNKLKLARKDKEDRELQSLQPEIVHKKKADGEKAGARLYAQAMQKQNARKEARDMKDAEAKFRASPAITQYTTPERKGNVYNRLYDSRRQVSVQRSGADARLAAVFACGDTDGDGVWCGREWAEIVRMCGGENADVSEEAFNAHCSHLGADPRIGLSLRHVEEAYRAYPERLSADHVRLCLHAERERVSRKGGSARLSEAGLEWLALGLGQVYFSKRSMPTEAEIVSAVELQTTKEGLEEGDGYKVVSPRGSPSSRKKGRKDKSPQRPLPFSHLFQLLKNRLDVPEADLEWLNTPPAGVEDEAVAEGGTGGRRELRHPLKVGDHCEAKDAEGEWWEVVITGVFSDGTYSARVHLPEDEEPMEWPLVHPFNMRAEVVERRLLRQGAVYESRRERSVDAAPGDTFSPFICSRSRNLAQQSSSTPVAERLFHDSAAREARRLREEAEQCPTYTPQITEVARLLAAKNQGKVEDRLINSSVPRGNVQWESQDSAWWGSLRGRGSPENSYAFRPHSTHVSAGSPASRRGIMTPPSTRSPRLER